MGTNPLIGRNNERYGTRFPDMSEIYDKSLIKIVDAAGRLLNLNLRHGVYMATTGPSYETPAEINMARTIGADACGMSTVPEAIIANYCGLKVIGLSCLTNYASGVSNKKLSHEEVLKTANDVKDKFSALIMMILKNVK
jgi:purine-nucleoside phosphorylase